MRCSSCDILLFMLLIRSKADMGCKEENFLEGEQLIYIIAGMAS